MFHVGRCGSTVLGSLLGQHSRIFWDGEIYNRRLRLWETDQNQIRRRTGSVDAIRFLRQRMRYAGTRFYLFEVKFFHLDLLDVDLSDYVERLKSLGVDYFIILDRRNHLRKIVSSLIARETQSYHRSHGENAALKRVYVDTKKLRVDWDEKSLVSYLTDYGAHLHELEGLLHGERILSLTYEDDVYDDPLVAYGKVINFLGARWEEVSVEYGRTNPFRLEQMILNFDEVKQVLSGTEFEWMLHD